MAYIGDIRLGDTFDTKFCTVTTTGAPTVLAGTPVISAYVGNSVTQITAGITLSVDFDGVVGLNNVRVVATSGNGYATASNYQLVITTGTVGGTSVVGYVVGEFSIEARSALMPTTAARTLDITATGTAGVDWANVEGQGTTVGLTATTVSAVTTVNGLAANVITAAATAADFGTEVAGAVWNEDATGHQTAGTFGQAIGDPGADTNTIFGAVVTGATGATIAADIITIDDFLDTEVAAIKAKTDQLTFTVANQVDANALAVGTGAITSSSYAAGAGALASGTSDSGSTTTMVDAARTEADTDYWKGCYILSTSGTNSGQVRLITAFDAATDTITFAPAMTQAFSTNTYEILASARVDVELWDGSAVNALVSGRVDSSVGAIAANAITAASMAADASAEIADAVWDEVLSSAAHTTNNSAAQRLKSLGNVIHASVVDATPLTTNFDTDLTSAVDNFYQDQLIIFTSGTLVGQLRPIYSYTGVSKNVAFDEPWTAVPANGDTFDVIPAHIHTVTNISATTATQVWDTDATTHQTGGSFGQAIGDPGADANTIYGAVVTGATGATIAADIITIDDFLDTEVAAIKAKTDQLVFTVANQVDANALTVGDKTGYAIGNGGIAAAAFAAGAIDAAAIAANAIGASELATDAAAEIADKVLARNVAGGSDGTRTVSEALYTLRNKSAISAGTLTVYQTDDATPAFTAAVTTAAGDPIASVDPA